MPNFSRALVSRMVIVALAAAGPIAAQPYVIGLPPGQPDCRLEVLTLGGAGAVTDLLEPGEALRLEPELRHYLSLTDLQGRRLEGVSTIPLALYEEQTGRHASTFTLTQEAGGAITLAVLSGPQAAQAFQDELVQAKGLIFVFDDAEEPESPAAPEPAVAPARPAILKPPPQARGSRPPRPAPAALPPGASPASAPRDAVDLVPAPRPVQKGRATRPRPSTFSPAQRGAKRKDTRQPDPRAPQRRRMDPGPQAGAPSLSPDEAALVLIGLAGAPAGGNPVDGLPAAPGGTQE